MVKNVKLSSANVRWHLRTLSVAKAQNINSAPRIPAFFSILRNNLYRQFPVQPWASSTNFVSWLQSSQNGYPGAVILVSVTVRSLTRLDLVNTVVDCWSNRILYWPSILLERIHDAPNHKYRRKQRASPWLLRDFNVVFLRFRLVFCPLFWLLLTCLHVKLVDQCLVTSHDKIRIGAILHV